MYYTLFGPMAATEAGAAGPLPVTHVIAGGHYTCVNADLKFARKAGVPLEARPGRIHAEGSKGYRVSANSHNVFDALRVRLEQEVFIGMAKSLTTTTAKEDVCTFFFGQRGLMAGLGIQRSKITKINPAK